MGILVPEAALPMGISVSNVYISFSGEVVYTGPRNLATGQYVISTWYKVFKDSTRNPESNIRIPISVTVDDMSGGDVFSVLYKELKNIYPGSQNSDYVYIPANMTQAQYDRGITLMKTVSEYISTHLGAHVDLENAYVAAENIFGVTGPATAELDALQTIYNNIIGTAGQ